MSDIVILSLPEVNETKSKGNTVFRKRAYCDKFKETETLLISISRNRFTGFVGISDGQGGRHQMTYFPFSRFLKT